MIDKYLPAAALACLALLLSFGSAGARGLTEIQKRITPVVRVVKAVSPSIVNVSTQQVVERRVSPFGGFGNSVFDSFFQDFAPGFVQRFRLQTLGSGMVIDRKGRVITNQHVIQNATKITLITKDGQRLKATLVGADAASDIAVLQVEKTPSLSPIPLGTSSDLMIGETVIAIGNPFGLSNTVTVGVISSLHRSIHRKGALYRGLIQTDASINPGNSGGPLLNILGKVIGINTAIYSNAQGIGFAIPIDMAKKIAGALTAHGRVFPAWFGVDCQKLSKTIARHFKFSGKKGILVTAVELQSPASLNGVKAGDIITAINKEATSSPLVFQQIINQYLPGDRVTVSVFRHGTILSLPLTLKRLKTGRGLYLSKRLFGFEVRNPKITEKRQLMRAKLSGIFITGVLQDTPAAVKGLKRGDLLLQLNKTPLRDVKTFRQILAKTLRRGQFRFTLLRGNYTYKIIFNLYNG